MTTLKYFILLTTLFFNLLQAHTTPFKDEKTTSFEVSVDNNFSPIDEINFQIYPNPFTDQLSIKANSNWEGTVQVNIRSLIGQHLRKSTVTLDAFNRSIKFDVKDLPDGVYFVEILVGNDKLTKKIMKKD